MLARALATGDEALLAQGHTERVEALVQLRDALERAPRAEAERVRAEAARQHERLLTSAEASLDAVRGELAELRSVREFLRSREAATPARFVSRRA